ncbi:MAG TPA: ABC transporter permease [Candidatus Saccharimonadales bacterium]|nr:ABC transporter permease [Candidatus Saccharimonadales bacterium]
MKLLDMLKRSGRNLRHAKMRTILTSVAIAVGGFTLTLTLAAATGARQYSDQLVQANFDPDAVAVAKDKAVFGGGTTGPQEYNESLGSAYGQQYKMLDQEDIAKLRDMPGVGRVVENYITQAQFITREGAKKYTGNLNVYDPGQKPALKAGEVGDTLPDGSVIMPDSYLKPLGFASAEAAVGQVLDVHLRQPFGQTRVYHYEVAAVSTKSSLQLDFSVAGLYLSQNDARAANSYVNAGTPQQGKLLNATVVAKNIDPEDLKQQLEDEGYVAMTSKDIQQLLNQIISVLQVIVLVFGFIALIASFFGVVNTQYISVLERTREIGLMKALGMSRKSVSRLFIIEATWIGFLGALIGSVAAIALGTALNPWITDKLNFGDQHLLVFTPIQVAGLIIFLMLVTTLAGLLPARKAAKLDPIEALRTE